MNQRSAISQSAQARQWSRSALAHSICRSSGLPSEVTLSGRIGPARTRNRVTYFLHFGIPSISRNAVKHSSKPCDIGFPQPAPNGLVPWTSTVGRNHSAGHAPFMVNQVGFPLIDSAPIFRLALSHSSIPLHTHEFEFTASSGVTAMAISTPREYHGGKMVKRKSDFGTTKVDGIIKVHARRERLSALEKRARLAKAIDRIPERKLAESPDCTVQAVRKWKAEDQFPSGIALIDLSRDFDSVFGAFCEMSGREADPRSMHTWAILQQMALIEGPDGQAARRVLRKIGDA